MFNIFGSSRLCDLAEDGDLEGVKRAIAAGKDVNERGMLKMTPLMAAASKGHEDVVSYLLSLPETDVDTLNAGGTTALMTAARGGHLGTVKILLADSRCDANRLGRWGGTALMNAAGFGHMDVVEELLKVEGISLAATYTDSKHSPITIARQNGFEDIAKKLEEFEAGRGQKPQVRQNRNPKNGGMRP